MPGRGDERGVDSSMLLKGKVEAGAGRQRSGCKEGKVGEVM